MHVLLQLMLPIVIVIFLIAILPWCYTTIRNLVRLMTPYEVSERRHNLACKTSQVTHT